MAGLHHFACQAKGESGGCHHGWETGISQRTGYKTIATHTFCTFYLNIETNRKNIKSWLRDIGVGEQPGTDIIMNKGHILRGNINAQRLHPSAQFHITGQEGDLTRL